MALPDFLSGSGYGPRKWERKEGVEARERKQKGKRKAGVREESRPIFTRSAGRLCRRKKMHIHAEKCTSDII